MSDNAYASGASLQSCVRPIRAPIRCGGDVCRAPSRQRRATACCSRHRHPTRRTRPNPRGETVALHRRHNASHNDVLFADLETNAAAEWYRSRRTKTNGALLEIVHANVFCDRAFPHATGIKRDNLARHGSVHVCHRSAEDRGHSVVLEPRPAPTPCSSRRPRERRL